MYLAPTVPSEVECCNDLIMYCQALLLHSVYPVLYVLVTVIYDYLHLYEPDFFPVDLYLKLHVGRTICDCA